jgi:hypothetical protein
MKNIQLFMGRGGAANQIPYFCHLCQKHTDDMVGPNQLPCSKCVLTKGKVCYCYPLMDADVVADLRKKKEVLDNTPEAERLAFVCEQMYAGDWQQYYLACNLHLVPIGIKPSVHVVPPKSNTTEHAAYVKNAVRTLITLGITCAPNTSLLKMRKQIVRALHIICRYCCYNDALAFGEPVNLSFSKAENQLSCVLHLYKHVIEKLVMLLFTRSMDELTSKEKNKRVKHIDNLQLLINMIALGKPEKPGHWNCPIKDGQEVGDCSFTDVQAKKVEMKLPLSIVKALTFERSKAQKWITVVKDLEWILTTLW